MAESSSPFINKNTAMDAYTESKDWLRPYFEPIDEFERIARNKPSSKIDPSLPKITDGTMAAIVQETPKRIIQQAPTGLLTSKDHPEFAKLADICLRDELIPSYNRMGNMLQKSWNMIGKSMTWGRATSYTFYTSTNGKFHTDFVIPYVKDILTEKGKVFAPDSNVRFMRSWYQKRDLKAILNQETRLEKKDKSYKSDWDLSLLAKMLDSSETTKPAELQTPAEREKGASGGGYEVIHAFQTGKNAEFYSFSPQFEDGKPLRVKVNNDPRGLMPFDDMYANIDLSNPLGRGAVELSGGVQNLIDQQMQMFQFMSTMEMAPPIKIRGNVNKTSLKLRPFAHWDMGTGPQNDVEAFALSNFALQNFPNNMQMLQSKIMQLNSSQDTSVGAENGNVGQSKTQAGVEASQQRLGVSDNYFRKQYEDWFEDQSETSVNIYFSEMKGTKTLPLDEKDRKEIIKTPAAQYVTPKGELEVPYKAINDVVFTFQVNAGSSEVKEDSENMDKLLQVYEMASANPNPDIQAKVPELFKIIVKETGVEGVDELFPEDQTDENGQPMQPQAQPQQPQISPEQIQQLVMQTVQEALQAEKANKPEPDPHMELIKALNIKFDQIPESARQQVLQLLGLDTGDMTPVEQKQALEQLSALNQADDHERAPELAQQDRDFQASQADKAAQQQAQQSQSSPTSQSSASTAQSQQQTPDPTMTPEETELVETLLQRGFNENDVEQAVMMTRQGMPLEQVIQTIGAKYV